MTSYRRLLGVSVLLALLLPMASTALAQQIEGDYGPSDPFRLSTCKPDVSIKKRLNTDSVSPGEAVEVTLIITNTGRGTLDPVTVMDQLDPGVTFDPNQPLGGDCPTSVKSYANGKITFRSFSLGEGQSCTIVYLVECKNPGTHTDVASVEAFCQDSSDDPVTDQDSRTFDCGECIPNVSLNKRLSTTSAAPGEEVIVTLRVTNEGSSTLDNIEVCDLFDEGTVFDPSQSLGGNCPTGIQSFQAQKVTFESFSLDPGESCTITYAISCDELGDRTDIATVRAYCDDSGTFDEDEAKATFGCDCVPDVSIRQTVDRNTVELGGEVRVTLLVSNDGSQPLTDIQVCDQLDEGVGFDQTQTLGGSCPTSISGFADQEVCFAPFDLAPGESCTIEYTVTCDEIGNHTSQATVIAFCDGTDLFDEDDDQVTFGCACVPEVKISQVVDRTNVSLGDEVRVTLEISNEGDTRLTRIAVMEDLDDGVGFDPQQTLGGTCPTSVTDFSNQTISFALFDLDPGQSCTIEYTVTCDAIDIHSNLAKVMAFCEDTEVYDADSDEARFGCECVPDVKLTQTVDRTNVQIGDEVWVRLNVSNQGDTRLTRVTVCDQLEPGVGFDPNQTIGGTCSTSLASFSAQKICFEPFDLDPGESCTIEYKVTCDTIGPHVSRSDVVAYCEDTDNTDEDEDQVTFGCDCVPDVELSQVVDRTSVELGGDVRVTINVSNKGSTRLTRVAVCDQLDAGVGFDPNQTLGGNCPTSVTGFAGQKISFAPFNLEPGETCTIEYTVTCDTAGPHTDTASVLAYCEDTEITDEDEDSVAFGCECVPNVRLTHDVDRTLVPLGGEVRVTLNVSNEGTTRLTRIEVCDQLAPGVGFDANQVVGGTCPTTIASFTGQKICFAPFELGPGESCTIEYTVTCDDPGIHTDRSTVIAYCEDTNITDEDDDEASFGCDCVPDVDLTSRIDRSTTSIGGDVRVTLEIMNDGDTELTRIEVCDQLDAGVGFDAGQTLGGDCPTSILSFENQELCFAPFDLAPGESCTIEYTVTCDEGDSHVNSQTVKAFCEDTNVFDEDDDQTAFSCDCVPDVEIAKTLDTSSTTISGEVGVVLRISNEGTDTLTDIEVCDQLDAGVGFDVNQSLGGDCPTSVTGFAGQKISFSTFSLPPGGSCTIEYVITCEEEGEHVDTATVKAFCEGTDIFDEDTSESTFDCREPECGLVVVKTATPDEIIPSPSPNCETVDDVTSVTFRYTGGDCSTSDNTQGSKTECEDFGPLNGPVRVVYTGKDPDEIMISPSTETIVPGTIVTLTAVGRDKLHSASEIEIRQGSTLLQFLDIHTSCSAPLGPGDIFGSLEVLGLNGSMPTDMEVVYEYTVTNNGDDLFDVSLVDDQLGIIVENLDLASGDSRTFSQTALITQTTTNRVDAVGHLIDANGPECTAFDEATVTVSDPPGSCDDGKPKELVFEYTGLDCSFSNTTQPDDKWDCFDFGTLSDPVRIVYTGDDDHKIRIEPMTESINVGDEVRLVAFDRDELKSESEIEIWRGNTKLQELRFHTSCSKPLAAGDQFGALLITNLIPNLDRGSSTPGDLDTEDGSTILQSAETTLYRATPNPFGTSTRIAYAVTGEGAKSVQIEVFDAAGRRIRSLVDGSMVPGRYQATWNARDDRGVPVTRGVYYARVTIDATPVATTRILFLK